MKTQQSMENKLGDALMPLFMEVCNESHQHAGPATESHFRITVVSEVFNGLSAVKRHQRIYALLSEQLNSGVHALALHTYTPEEWQDAGHQIPESPQCRGGSRTDIDAEKML
ncbi:MAG: BolA/IbaG family iron-sulfur metabolism protein [Pseudomonadales bacterium]|nr:BolA/IbaG family iron-sulfur metabolism protein [Pseudomonadales bacterium]